MKNLYKKIYEAINTGIQKALILDDEDEVSMNYQHKKIVNNTNLMHYYVDDLLQDSDIEYNYRQIIKYYEETGYKYKVKDLNELKTIFDKIKDIENVLWEWIENMKDYVSIVLDDNSEINFYKKTDKKPLFLKFASDDILGTENEILIYLHADHYIPKEIYSWQTKKVQIQDDEYLINEDKYGTWEKTKEIAEKDYSGYEACLRIQNIVLKDPDTYGKIPAIDYCLNLNINGYQGYLPSMGQLRIISDTIDLINYIFKYLNLKEINDFNNDDWRWLGYWWSSTENNNYSAQCLNHGLINYTSKDNKYGHPFPLFAIKKI
ncbi:MAG: hypothetical protein [Wendovervirus sonii]|uniref:DUF1566 domain-containing protein n=1 Tax=phage Lak_Megaphage_Sonny TaxID=3109229 RepID=A0ABZ0Z5B7_9CAUD|nr:MAG: hypothetical protein [phage Lak_Megaphage_Sonny]